MPDFVASVRHWQQTCGVGAADTTLVGFSQGAILSLAASQAEPGLAGQVISIAGRLVPAPTHAARGTRLHFLHGTADTVVPLAQATKSVEQLQALGAQVSLDRFEGLGHGMDIRLVRTLIGYL
jgi:phospholipase/carboxylesterase